MPIPNRNSVFLEIGKELIDEITTESGFKLYLSPEYNFEENATVEGFVSSIPKNCPIDISIGDNVAFSYTVISNRDFPDTSDYFVPLHTNDGYVKIFMNSRGEKLRMTAHQGAISIFWTGVFFNKNGEFEPEKSIQGSESDVDRWAHANFRFGNCENFIYKNLLCIDNKEYWKCPTENIFAKKIGNEIVSVGNRVICEIIDIPVDKREFQKAGLRIPDSSVQLRFYDRGRVISGGERIGVSKGDIVSFESKFCEKYKLFGKNYFLIKESRINGVWQET